MQKIVPSDAPLIPDDAKKVFEGVVYDVYHWDQQLYDGSFTTFERLRRADTVEVVGIVDGDVVIIEDSQPDRAKKLTFPGGRVDPNDSSILDAAKREMREETGLTFSNWKLVECVQLVGKIEWFIYLFVAWGDCEQLSPVLDAGEKIVVRKISESELSEYLENGKTDLSKQGVITPQMTIQDIIDLPEFKGKVVDR